MIFDTRKQRKGQHGKEMDYQVLGGQIREENLDEMAAWELHHLLRFAVHIQDVPLSFFFNLLSTVLSFLVPIQSFLAPQDFIGSTTC